MKWECPKHNRFHRYGIGVEVEGMWYSYTLKNWSKTPKGDFTNIFKCKSLRAFRRHLQKHPNIRGKAHWINRYIGHDVYA